MLKGGCVKKKYIFYEANIFIEKQYDKLLEHDDQRKFIKYCDTRLQDTATWTPSLLNLLTDLEAELDYLENTDML